MLEIRTGHIGAIVAMGRTVKGCTAVCRRIESLAPGSIGLTVNGFINPLDGLLDPVFTLD
jgi:hypothetical protein